MSYEFNMVDMGGIDIATVNGTVVEGLYNKLLEGMDACGNLILYNWKFAEIEIVPSACSILIEDDAIIVNGTIRVSSEDVVSLIWVDPPPAPVEPITITGNGVYTAQEPLSGYNPVTVDVSSSFPEIGQIVHAGNIANYEIVEDGLYAILIAADGYSGVDITASLSSESILFTDKQVSPNGPYRSCSVVFIAECSAGDLLSASATQVARQGLYVVHFPYNYSIEESTMVTSKDTPASVSISTNDLVFFMAVATGDSRSVDVSGGWANVSKITTQHVFMQGMASGSISVTASGTSYATNVSFATKLV